jgi:hypothetical protein
LVFTLNYGIKYISSFLNGIIHNFLESGFLMQIVVKDFIEKVSAADYQQTKLAFSAQEIEQLGIEEICNRLWTQFQTMIAKDKLARVEASLNYSKQTILVQIESGIINLPFENIKRVDNFFDDLQQEVQLNAYLVVQSPTVNSSGLRIEEICSVAEFLQTKTALTKTVIKVAELIALSQKNQAEALEKQEA